MNGKNTIWKYATACVVLLIILNPEMLQLALFIDAMGLELFLMLIELQLLAITGFVFNSQIKPALLLIYQFFRQYLLPPVSWQEIRQRPGRLILLAPSQVSVMQKLVFAFAIAMLIDNFQ